MKKGEIAKKLGIATLALMLALPCALQAGGAADIQAAKQAGGQQGLTHFLHSTKVQDTGTAEGLEITMETYQNSYKAEDGEVYKEVSFEYPVAAGDSEAAKAFNKFYKNVFAKWKKETEKDLAEAEETVEAVRQYADGRRYTDKVACEITSSDADYISVLQAGDDYRLGAHGSPYRYTYIFDARTGRKVSAAKVLGLSKAKLNDKVRKLYMKEYDKVYGTDEFPYVADREEVQKVLEGTDFNKNLYYLKDGKVHFYVYPYEIAPYAAGFVEVAVKVK